MATTAAFHDATDARGVVVDAVGRDGVRNDPSRTTDVGAEGKRFDIMRVLSRKSLSA
jgi:hypothetical protein